MGDYGKVDIPVNAETPAAFATRAIQWWNSKIVQRHAQAPSSATRASQDKGQEVSSEDANASSVLPDSLSSLQTNTTSNVLVVSHGGVIGTLAVGLLGSRKLRCAKGVAVGRCMNASISVVEVDENGKGVLVSFGDTTHLDGELVEVNVDEMESNGGNGDKMSAMR